jgi:hypothetical protein
MFRLIGIVEWGLGIHRLGGDSVGLLREVYHVKVGCFLAYLRFSDVFNLYFPHGGCSVHCYRSKYKSAR